MCAEGQFRSAAVSSDHRAGLGLGQIQPADHGLGLVFPRPPGNVVGAAEVGIDEHLLRREPDRRMGIAAQRIGEPDRLGVEAQGLLEVGFDARGRQIADQAGRPGLDVRPVGAEVDGLAGFVEGLAQAVGPDQELGQRHAVLGILGVQLHGGRGLDHRLAHFVHRRQHPAQQPTRPGIGGLQGHAPAPGRGGPDRSGSSIVVSARSTNVSAETGSIMISATLVIGLRGPLGGLEVEHHAALGIGLTEHFAHVVRDRDGRTTSIRASWPPPRRETWLQPNHDRRDLVGRIVYFYALERLDRVKLDGLAVGHGGGLRPPPGLPHVRLRRHPGVTPLKLAGSIATAGLAAGRE